MTLSKKPPNKLAKAPPAPVSASTSKAHAAQQTTKANKTFQVAVWGSDNEGEKIIMYADSGMGKTTLASMLPTPTFAGLDDGGRKIRHPITGEKLKNIPGIETFADFRAATQQQDLFNDYETYDIYLKNFIHL